MISLRVLYWLAVAALAVLLTLGPEWPWQGRKANPQAPSPYAIPPYDLDKVPPEWRGKPSRQSY